MTAFSWDSQPLGTVADLCLGKMLDQNKNRGDHLPYLANVNVRWGEFGLENLRTMRFERKEADRYGLKSGDIVMCEGGEPGRCAIWKNQVPGMMIQKALHRIRPKSLLDSSFLFYQFLHMGSLGKFDQFFTGATIKHLSGDKLAKVQVVVPPLPIQHRIASILSAYDDLIENNRKRIAILEEMARRLYREWFVHFRYPGHESVPVVDSPLGRFPQGWEIVPLHAAVCLNPRPALGSAPIPFIPMNCLSNDSMLIDGIEEREEPTGSRFQNGDTLLARITPCLENGKTAFVQCLVDGQAACGSTEFIVMRSLRLSPEIVYLLARSDEFRGIAIKSMSGATGRQRVQESSLSGFKIPCPPADICSQFSNLAAPFFKLCENLHRQTQVLRRTRDLLLPRLMSGQLAVEAAEAAVP